jgi:hypothetical protein
MLEKSPTTPYNNFEDTFSEQQFADALEIVNVAGAAHRREVPADAPRSRREALDIGSPVYIGTCRHHGPEQRFIAASGNCHVCKLARVRAYKANKKTT